MPNTHLSFGILKDSVFPFRIMSGISLNFSGMI